MIKKRLIKLLSHAKKYIVYQVLFQWLALLCQVLIVAKIAGIIKDLFEKNLDIPGTRGAAIIILAAVAARFVCDYLSGKASFGASADVKQILRVKIHEKLLRLGASYREKISSAELVQMSVEGVEQLEIYFGKYLSQFIYSMIAPITLFVILFPVNAPASLVLLVCVPLIPAAIVAVQKIAKRLLSKYWGIYTQLGDSFLENLQGLTTLKIYEADGEKSRAMDEESERFRRITMKVLTMQLNSISVMDIVAYGGAALGMIVALFQFAGGGVDLKGVIMIILLASEFFIPLRLLGSFFHIAMNGMAASDKIFDFLDLPEPKQGGKRLPKRAFDISLEQVSFGYQEERLILQDVSMEIPSGSFVSVVGLSGSGKSTIAGILMGRNRGFKGKIHFGDISLKEIEEESLMEQVTLVKHDSYLFGGTIRENLLLGNPKATEKEMERVLWQVNLLGFVQEQKGLDTILLESGSNLSGGQRQRLSLARALLHDSPVYIFDEATSNIDMESEALIMKVIYSLAKTKTVFMISHRLANVTGSDCIYMLKDGRVSECGTHEELMGQGKAYAKLFMEQKALEEYGLREGGNLRESK
ncbi:ABC transporter ATP-binding protein/permease [Eubacterium oxidoreducens]|uniref:ABC-type transport system involved in cytochrome bd biosynthesis, ATPase and permease components n=1 Tax=Eubacterium oxidoreducens TaxID=1732 RepID=A0A1G6A4C5_EUBOX|nr:ABC transporter ATP-binding protein/permease [Eubacterium oxidoreducens]SDB02883.1 ABC-type transport system involved in cytochrome bd biosynthesis, ATPase and permease components [Eubacterium oxidoreducens]